MDEFKDSPSALIADVDCTAAGEPLCQKHGVSGYPTIKWGDPNEMKDYEGGRSFEDLKKFAEESLGPTCGPGENIGLCNEATKAKIQSYEKMDLKKLEEKISKTQKDFEVETPLMKKVIGYLKSQEGKDGNSEL